MMIKERDGWRVIFLSTSPGCSKISNHIEKSATADFPMLPGDPW